MCIYKYLLSLILLLICVGSVFAEDNVAKIEIKGNKIISEAKVFSRVKIRAGQPYNENVINADVKELYATGFFDAVNVEKTSNNEGIVLAFVLKEKPVLKEIIISGNKKLRRQHLLKEIPDLKEGVFIDDYKIEEAIRKLKDFYKKKGFNRAEITYKLDATDSSKAKLTFVIEENTAFRVVTVDFDGAMTFSRARLMKVVKTRWTWWLNHAVFKEDVLQDDKKRLIDFYRSQGFSAVEISSSYDFVPNGVIVRFKIKEGFRSYLGKIVLVGYHNVLLSELKKVMELQEGGVYSEQAVYEESSRLREVYMEHGYVFAAINPVTAFNPETQKVDLNFDIAEDEVAYIDKINIKGNVKTRDKIIRHELRIYPGERFDGGKVKRSKERLENLDFFKEVRFDTEPKPQEKKVDVDVNVTESKTGYFSFGGGYSSVDKLMGFVELRQRNFDALNWQTFTGAGEDVDINTSIGSVNRQYSLSFTHPWIFDTPYSFGFDVFDRTHKEDEDTGYPYEENDYGGALRLGREFTDYLSGTLSFKYEHTKISNIAADYSTALQAAEGSTTLLGPGFMLVYDSRDNANNPHHGWFISNNVELYGGPFGGTADFYKDYFNISYFIPFAHKSTLELRVGSGFSNAYDNSHDVPIFERFYAGGSGSLRGYEERKVGPLDPQTGFPVGGESIFSATTEYTYPIVDFFKVAWFFDCGNVWSKNSDYLSSKLFKDTGIGLRVKTPIGPISVDYGWPLDIPPGENHHKQGRFTFNMSRGF